MLDSRKDQRVNSDTFIFDSSSGDGTQELAKELVVDVTVIAPNQFNHC